MTVQSPAPSALSRDACLDELADYLRPPGAGIHTISTGKAELEAKTRAYLGRDAQLDRAGWRAHLAEVIDAPLFLLAIPSDTGAGIVRGAARGPEAIRAALGHAPVAELGDVFCVPHLLDEELMSDTARARVHAQLYPHRDGATGAWRPVTPLGMATRVYRLVAALNPSARIMLLGGDHTVSWAPMDALLAPDPAANADVAIVHFDAHTDLLPERLGIRYCFATWAFHANERLGHGQRLLQLGIRASGKDRAHWESQLGVRQIWGEQAATLTPEQLGALVRVHLETLGAKRVYVSNDIDGTDAAFAAACGTPEPGGLHPDQVLAVYRALHGGPWRVIGADLVEVAPGLSLDAAASARTVDTAKSYVQASLELLGATG